MKRVLFLFNHDAAHQVAHLASVAAAMARTHPEVESIVAYSTPAIRRQVESIIAPEDAARLRWEELALPAWARWIARPLDKLLPATRLLRLRLNTALFASVDMLVSTERTCLRLKKSVPAKDMPLFALVPHGAGDRNVSYHPDFAKFDRVYVAGRKVVDQLVAHGTPRERIEVVGYPKFEGVDLDAPRDFFGNGRPTFVYNTHFDPYLSSWYDAGPDLLRWFASEQGQAFNCIFAPHVMLFRKAIHVSPEYKLSKRRPGVPQEALDAPNILVDVDSERLFDMSYTLGADGYIGDASSQIYEFLARPRPAFFLDCRKDVQPDDDEWMIYWKAGPVAHDVAELTTLLPDYAAIGEAHRAVQQELFAYTFDIGEKPASQRAADAIAQAISA